jgi:hypothetical protein
MAWNPTTAAGRVAGKLALASLALVVVCVGVYVWMTAVTPEDSDPPGILLVIFLLSLYGAVLIGLGVAVAVAWAFFGQHDRSASVKSVIAVSMIFVALFGFFVIAESLSGTHGRFVTIRVDLETRNLQDDYEKAVKGPIDVVIRVTNNESTVQLVSVMELRSVDASGAPVPPLSADTFPLVDGVVRHFTYPGEGTVVFWATAAAVSFATVPGAEPPPRPVTLSRVVEPGGTLRLHLPGKFPAGTEFVVFSDKPGDYAASRWVRVVLR